MTLISVITPNYNYGKYLKGALDSILNTNHSNEYEIVVVDDGSTDDSAEVLREYEHDPRVRIFYQPKNCGVAASMNFGISRGKGEFLHPFSADDLHESGAIDLMVENIRQFPEATLFSSDYTVFEESSASEYHSFLPVHQVLYYDPKQVMRLFRRSDFWISGHTAFFHKTTFTPYVPQLGSACDWLNYHILALKQGVCYLPQSLVKVRRHPQSYSFNPSLADKKKMWIYLLEQFEDHPEHYKPLIQSGICRMLGLKSIYLDLLKKPRYWRYLFPMITRELEKLCSLKRKS